MNVTIPLNMVYDTQVSDRELRVYCLVYPYFNHNGVCVKEFSDLAATLKMDKGGLRRAINALSDREYLKVMTASNGGEYIYIPARVVIHKGEAEKPTEEAKEQRCTKAQAEEFIKLWNSLYGTRKRLTDGLRRSLSSRLATFTFEELCQAARNREPVTRDDDEYWGKHQHIRKDTEALLRNDDRVQKYLERQPEETTQVQERKRAAVKAFKFG